MQLLKTSVLERIVQNKIFYPYKCVYVGRNHVMFMLKVKIKMRLFLNYLVNILKLNNGMEFKKGKLT